MMGGSKILRTLQLHIIARLWLERAGKQNADILPVVHKPSPTRSIRHKTAQNRIFEVMLPSQVDGQENFERLAFSPRILITVIQNMTISKYQLQRIE
jgi:hypothetical protein